MGIYLTVRTVLESDWTYGADVLISNFAEEELWTVGDGLPCTQRVDVLLPVFNLRMRKE